MGKITGIEKPEQLPAKVVAMYDAVKTLMEQGKYAPDLSVSMITEQAGIGKGTAYEYFDFKEELIACALAYQVQGTLGTMYGELQKREGFQEQIDYMMSMGERHQQDKAYLMCFLHILTDNTELSRLVQQKIREYVAVYGQGEKGDTAPITILLREMILQGRERCEIRRDQPVEYQIYTLGARLLAYMIFQCEQNTSAINAEEMYLLVIKGIMEELAAQD